MSETAYATEIQSELSTDDGGHDRFAHYVPKEQATEAFVYGWPVIALCGKVWVPSRDPEKFPICPTCKEIYSELGDNGDS